MTETIYILMMLSGLGLFALGGTELPWFGRGFKWLRRFLLPGILGLLIYWLGIYEEWQIIASMVVLCVVLHLGYGERTPYWRKFLVGVGFVVPSLFFGLTYWQLITPIAFLVLFVLSNLRETAKDFTWKIVESIVGILISITIIAAMQRPW